LKHGRDAFFLWVSFGVRFSTLVPEKFSPVPKFISAPGNDKKADSDKGVPEMLISSVL